MTKKFQLSKYISVCVLSFLLLMAMQFVCFSRTVARADGIGDMDTAYPYDQEYFDLFTDSDNLYNSDGDTKSIYNYIDSLYKTKISRIEKIPCENSSKYKNGNSGYAGIICTVDGDDPIVKIIPKELFARRGVYLHIGREYGFYVNTQKLEDNSNQSTVFVFDIEKKLLDPAYPSQYIIEIRPLFQYKYCFLTSDYGFDADGKSYSELCYKLNCSMSSVVVPKPEVKVDKGYNTNYSFEETKEYFIKDASFGLALFNEQEPNIDDTGYDRKKDNGSFITGTKINFSGVSNKKVLLNEVLPIVKLGLGFIPYVGNIISIGETIYEVSQNASKEFRDELAYIDDDRYSTEYFNSRDEQLEYYSNLTKSGFASLSSNDTMPLLIGRTTDNDYVKASFTLGMTENWYTRAIDSIKLSIVTESTKLSGVSEITSRITAERSTKNYLRTINEKTLSLEDSQSFSMLENGCAEFTFDAKYDSDYNLNISDANQMSIKIDGAETSFSDNKATKYLSAGKHIIRIDGKNSDKLTSYVSITPKTISGSINSNNVLTINGNGRYLLKINSLAHVKRLTTGNSSVKIEAIYGDNRNSYNSYGGITSASEITHPFVRGDYYVVLNNTLSYQKTINFSIGEPLTLTSSRTVNSNNSNYTFVKFTGDNSYSQYVLTFSNMKGLSVVIYNDDDLITNAGGEYFPGLFYKITLDPKQTIYIGIKNSSSTSNTLTIRKESAAYQWKIKNEKNGSTKDISAESYSVIRNTTLTFELYVNGKTVSNVSYSYKNQDTYWGAYEFSNPKNNQLTLAVNCPVGGNGIIVTAYVLNEKGVYDDISYIKIIPQMEDIPNIITGMINGDDMKFEYSIPSYVCAIDYVIYPSSKEFTQLFSVSQYNKIGNVRFDDFDKNLLSKEQEGSVNFENNYNSLGYTTPQNIKIVIKKIYYIDVDNGITSLSKSMTSEYSINSMFAGGSGTSDSPYQITCKRHFENMLSYNTGEYKLMNNLWLDNRSEFKEFKAILNGNNKTITMTIDTYNTSGDIGLFSTNSGTIKNLKLKAKVWSNTYSSEWQNIGAFCGVNKGTIEDCTLYSYFGESSYLEVSGNSYTYWNVDIYVSKHNTSTGGITGINYGTIRWTVNKASICSRGDIGGIAGRTSSEYDIDKGGVVECSENDGRIYYFQYNGEVAVSRSVGGIVGYQHSGNIKYCQNYALISYDYPRCDTRDIRPRMGTIVGHKCGTVLLCYVVEPAAKAYLGHVDTGSLYGNQTIYAGDRPFGREN